MTNSHFLGSYAQYALASQMMIAQKPRSLDFVEAASAPVVAVTAWQMLFDYAHAKPDRFSGWRRATIVTVRTGDQE
jgi:NADPH:quinone reductase-like Zn-dependent oxidoreductase